MLAIQEYLRAGGSIEELDAKYAISTKPHGKSDNLILFKYSQIDSPFAETIVRECRGIILDRDNNWDVVNLSMFKFFNFGEGHAAPIDWATAKVMEKIDGSLCQLYPYRGEWHIATSGTPDAACNVGIFDFSFAELFWNTFGDRGQLPPPDCGKCFWFELCSPYNKIVVRHQAPTLTLLGGRDLLTLQEMPVAQAHEYFPAFPVPREFSLGSFEEITDAYSTFSGLEQEGFVVCDGSFNRCKLKHPQYLLFHHMIDSLSSRKNLVEIVRSGEISEVLTGFPEYETMLLDIDDKLNALVAELEEAYDKIKHIEVQKDFAMEANKTRCPSALYTLRAKKTKSIRHFMRDIRVENLMQLLGSKE